MKVSAVITLFHVKVFRFNGSGSIPVEQTHKNIEIIIVVDHNTFYMKNSNRALERIPFVYYIIKM